MAFVQQVLRVLALVPLVVMAVLAVVPVPTGELWKPAIGATEWGHVLALLALGVAVPARGWRPDVGTYVALAAALALLSPWARSLPVDSEIRRDLMAAFGTDDVPFDGKIPGLGYVPPVVAKRLSAPDADGGPLRVDWYEGKRGAPLVVAIHGGSWNSGDPEQLVGMYQRLAAHGYHVAALSYRLAPQHHYPTQERDIASVIAWLNRQPLGHDPKSLVLYGRSAGGHLALMHALTAHDAAIKGVLALYPITDFDWSWDHPTDPRVADTFGTITDLLGRRREDDPDRKVFHAASPFHQLHPDAPPMLIAHGGRDELVFFEQSRRFVVAAKEKAIPCHLLALPWATHGFEANLDGPSGSLWTYAVDRFLERYAPVR